MRLTISAPPDFDLLECVQAHGWRHLLPFGWTEEEKALLRVEEISPGVVASVKIRQGDDRKLVVETESDVDPEELQRRVGRMLQLDIPMDAFHAFCAEHPELSLIPSLRQGRLLRSPTLFEDVCKVIATTNTTWSQTIGMTERIVKQFGTAATGPDSAQAFPRPEQIASVSLEDFATSARMGYRNSAVHRVATDIADGRLDLEAWQDPEIPSADLYKFLLTLPGIGPYAASCLLIYLGKYDRVNVDSWARTMVGKELGRPVTDKEVHAFFASYGPWKALVYHFYPWKHEGPVV